MWQPVGHVTFAIRLSQRGSTKDKRYDVMEDVSISTNPTTMPSIQRLMAQQQQQNAMLQQKITSDALALSGAHNIAMMSQQGLTTLAISGNNAHTAIALSGKATLQMLTF